ncbi:MAG: S8 family peptidase, partial [Candidatus Rokuibacteriota bacterium]
RDPLDVVERVAAKAGLERWRIEPVAAGPPRRAEFELLPPRRGRTPAPGAAWDATYRLRDQPGVVDAEPLFRYEVPDMYRPATRRAGGGGGHHPATTNHYEWSVDKARVIQAWQLFGAREPGAGVTVGHPDTGYTPHPELADPARLLASQGYDYDDDDPDATDDLESGFLDHPGHGTGTGSVIASNRGPAPGDTGPAFVSGVAPHASLIPIRATESVVLLSMRALRHAIDHAVAKGAHVISISLGGPLPSATLRAAIRRAVDAGTIVLAAAGNHVWAVVYPAVFEEVIAVAASTIEDEPWSGSCRGDAVDITAPGASVWRAAVDRDGASRYVVTRGSGTSFAGAITAGVAALWISYHGWATLVRRYGTSGIARVFKSLLQSTCRTPRGWDTDHFGPGIVDARALLAAPLLAEVPARKLRDARRAAVVADATGLEAIVHLLPHAPRTGVERAVAGLLRVSDRALPRVLQDVGDELAFQLVMHPPLREELERRAKRPAAARAAPGKAPALD